MNEEAIKRIVEFVAKQGAAKAALQPASLAPQPATMTAYDPSLREKISGVTADMLMNASLAKDNYEAQELGGKLTNLAEFSPLGMVTAADDFSRAGDMPTAALAALGMVPGVGKGAREATKLAAAAIKVDGKIYRGATHNAALGAAEAATGKPIFRDYVDQGFVDDMGRFMLRDDPNAALLAISSNQINDPLMQELVQSSIRQGHSSPLTAEHINFGDL